MCHELTLPEANIHSKFEICRSLTPLKHETNIHGHISCTGLRYIRSVFKKATQCLYAAAQGVLAKKRQIHQKIAESPKPG